MTGHDQSKYITEAEAAALLNRSDRQVRRYGRTGKVNVQEIGGARHYLRSDVEALAKQLRDKDRTRPATTELVPLGDMLDMLREKDEEIARLNERLQSAALEIGRLQGQLEAQQRQLPDERTRPDTTGHVPRRSFVVRVLRRLGGIKE